jgi:hypothetical protein
MNVQGAINELLRGEVASCLRKYLDQMLPQIRADYWNSLVIPNLTEPQQRGLHRRQVESLKGLDIASLLKVFDANFYDFDQRENLGRIVRTYGKEMQDIRNRDAHPSDETSVMDDYWRDLDTMQRFARAIGTSKEVLEKFHELKTSLLRQMAESAPVVQAETAVTKQEVVRLINQAAKPQGHRRLKGQKKTTDGKGQGILPLGS